MIVQPNKEIGQLVHGLDQAYLHEAEAPVAQEQYPDALIQHRVHEHRVDVVEPDVALHAGGQGIDHHGHGKPVVEYGRAYSFALSG